MRDSAGKTAGQHVLTRPVAAMRVARSVRRLTRAYAVTLGLAAAGGASFFALDLPLPWMLGAMAATILAALARLPLKAPERMRPWVIAVIGVMLGSGFRTDTFSQLAQWSVSLTAMLTCVAVQAVAVTVYFRWIGKLDPVTALFSAMPGGLVEMMEIGRQNGGDAQTIILAHAVRIVLVIALVAGGFRLVLGLEVSGAAPMGGGTTGPVDLAILVACGVAGGLAGLRFRLPAPTFLGPMLCSAAVHMLGWTSGSPPVWLVVAAQITLGAIVGSRFIGVSLRAVARAFALGLGATVVMLTVTMAFALLLAMPLGQAPAQILLAYAPGGLTEMSLVSLSMGADVAYIATHHLMRVVTLLAIAGSVLAPIAARLGKP